MSEHVLSILVKAIGASAASKEVRALEGGIGRISATAHRGQASLAHFGDRVKGLAGAAGLVGLAGGALSVAGALEQGIEKANTMALAVEKLSGVTGLSAHSASQLVAVFEKFGIDTEGAAKIAGFAEKTLGNLAKTSAAAGKSAGDLAKAQDGVTKAHEKLIVATTKLRETEASGKASASQLQAARFRVRDATEALRQAEDKLASDRATKGSTSTSKLMDLDREYGLHLVDAKGKLVDFESELKQVADVYTSSIDPARKAALAAQLFGKGYVALIPILKLGSQGIAEAEAEADKLGLTLKNAQDVKNVHDFIDAQREAKDSIAGLEVQIGLLVMPDLTGALRGLSTFVQTHRDQIKKFFSDGLKVAEGFASFVTGTLIPTVSSVGSTLLAAWNTVPAPLRDMILKGAVADRTVKFLFGFSPAHMILDGLESGIGKGLAGLIGKEVVQPVFVTNQVPGGAAGGAAGGGLGLLTATGIAAAIVVAAVPIGQAFADALPAGLKGVNGQGESDAQLAHERADLAMAAATAAVKLSGDGSDGRGMAGVLTGVISHNTDRLKDDLVDLKRLAGSTLAAQYSGFAKMVDSVRNAKGPAQIKAAVKQAIDLLITKAQGNAASTNSVLHDLKAKLNDTHDPKTKAALQAAIKKVEAKVPGREYVQRQIDEARKLVADGKLTKAELVRIKGIQHNLLAHGDKHAAAQVGQLISIAKSTRLTAARISTYATGSRQNEDTGGKGNAVGALFNTHGPTHVSPGNIAGEAGTETVAILRNPRPYQVQQAAPEPTVVVIHAPSVRDMMRGTLKGARYGFTVS